MDISKHEFINGTHVYLLKVLCRALLISAYVALLISGFFIKSWLDKDLISQDPDECYWCTLYQCYVIFMGAQNVLWIRCQQGTYILLMNDGLLRDEKPYKEKRYRCVCFDLL